MSYKAELKALKKAGVPDVKKYIELTSDDSYSTWEKKFTNTAKLQGFGNQLNPIYTPSTPEEKEVFDIRQQHLYEILNKILLTPKGKDILSDHILDNNAQKVLSELKEHQTESVIATRRRRECLQQILHARIDPNQNGESQIVEFKELLRTYESYLGKSMDEAVKLSYLEDFCSSAPGMKNIPNLTSIIQKATKTTLSTATQMEIVESQALMEDNAALLPQGDGRIRAHRSVNMTNFNPLPADDPDEFLLDNGDGFITVYRSDVRGQLQQSHKLPKSLWTTFTQDEKRIWLSFSVDTRRRILGCLDNEPSDQQNEDQASPMSSAVRQHAQPRHQSRLRSYNLRPINGQPHRNNQRRQVRLTDRYDLIGEPGNGGGDNNQDINVRLVDQYNNAAGPDAVTTDEVATDEIVPRPNTELDVGTAMLTTNDTSSSAGTANNTLFINNIKSSSSNSPATRNPFDVRRLLEDRPPSSAVASEDGELAPYCPTALCLSVSLLVMLTTYQLPLRQNLSLRSLFCGSHPSRKTRKEAFHLS